MKILSILALSIALACSTAYAQQAPAPTVSIFRANATAAHTVMLNWTKSTSEPTPLPTTQGYNIYTASGACPTSTPTPPYPWLSLNSSPIAAESYTDATNETAGLHCYFATFLGAGPTESLPSNLVVVTIPAQGPTFMQSVQSGITSMSFAYILGQPTPAPQTIAIIATPATPLPVKITTNQPWLTVTTDSPTTKVNVTVSVNVTGLAAGTYTGNVISTNTDGTAINTPLLIPVTLTVIASTQQLSKLTVKTFAMTPTKNKITVIYSDSPSAQTTVTFFGIGKIVSQQNPGLSPAGAYTVIWSGPKQNGFVAVSDSQGGSKTASFAP
jgi:hypothetical protein